MFEITAGHVISAPESNLQKMATDFASRHIALTIGLQSIAKTAGESCGGEEGYGDVGESASTAARLHALGIKLESVGLDEPLWFGHYDPDPRACQLSIDEIARRVALNVLEYKRYFPRLTMYTIEPVPGAIDKGDWAQNFRALLKALLISTGIPVTSLFVDVNWALPGYADSVSSMADLAHSEHVKFGLIYNGDGRDLTDVAWVASARKHIDEIEIGHHVHVDLASIQTWDPHPRFSLPMESGDTLGSVVGYYVLPKSHLVASRSSTSVRGHLVDSANHPVANSQIEVQSLGSDPRHVPRLRTVVGVAPKDAMRAIIGMRVNAECYCAGFNDLLVGAVTYQENDGGKVKQSYDVPVASRPDVAHQITVDGKTLVQLLVKKDQQFGFNSPDFAVTPGANYSFTVPLGVMGDGGLFGSVTLIWFDSNMHGLTRTNITLQRDVSNLDEIKTDANGYFELSTSNAFAQNLLLRLEFRGNSQLRGAIAYLRKPGDD